MTTFNNNQAYVEDAVIAPGAIGDTGATTTTMFGNNTVSTGAKSVGGVANIA